MVYLPFHPSPKKPDLRLPANACDAHCHVFGPESDFPYAPESKYKPVDAAKEQLFELHRHLGFERSVIVQASCHGTNNDAMVDALKTGHGRYRGVAVIREDISQAELAEMHEAGVRGIRFNFVKRLVDVKPRDYYIQAAEKIAKLGWHVIVYFEAQDLKEQEDLFRALPVPVCIDHLGRPDVNAGLEDPDFQRICNLVETRPDTWIKVGCPERLTKIGPPYTDALVYARYLVERFPDQVLWGTDWPHPNMKSHMPDDGFLVDTIADIAPGSDLRAKLLVDNPTRLYWPELIQAP